MSSFITDNHLLLTAFINTSKSILINYRDIHLAIIGALLLFYTCSNISVRKCDF